LFGGTEPEVVANYRRYVAEGKTLHSPWELLKHQVFLGSDAFVEQVRRALPTNRDLSEVPRAQRRSPAKPLDEYAKLHADRNEAIAAAYAAAANAEGDWGVLRLALRARQPCDLQGEGGKIQDLTLYTLHVRRSYTQQRR
jgi:hypothetical protein